VGVRVLIATGALSVFAADARAGSYAVERWGLRDGLPQSSVTDIAQDEHGYLWLTTFGGLARFDGLTFEVFELATHPELGANRFVGVERGAGEALWFSTQDRGLLRWDGERFHPVALPGSLQGQEVSPPVEDREGRIWVTVGTSLVSVEGDRVQVYFGAARVVGQSRWLQVDDAGALWIFGLDNAVCWEGPCEHPRQLIRPDNELARSLSHSERGTQWNLWWSVPEACEQAEMPEDASLDDGWVRLRWWEERLWCAHGSTLYARGEAPIPLGEGNGVARLMVDREGSLWAGLHAGGLAQIRSRGAERFGAEQGLSETSTWGLAEDDRGRIWLHSRPHLEVLDGGQVTAPPPPVAALTDIKTLSNGPDGDVWLLSSEGLSLFRGGALTRWPDAAEHGLASAGLAVVEPSGDAIWIGGEGAVRYEAGRETARLSTADLGAPVTAIRLAPDGAVWFGTGEGIAQLHEGTLTHLGPEDGLSAGTVRDIYFAPDGAAWVGTYGGGLSRVRGAQIDRVTAAQGLCEPVVSRILADDQGYLWLNGNRGVSRVRLADLEAAADGGADPVQCALFDSGEGNGGGGLRASDGSLWFPTITGVSRLTPRATSPSPPGLHLRSLEVTAPGEVTARFAGLSFLNPMEVRFQHRLVGYDDRWIEGAARSARYTHLPPGDYRFEVRARGSGGVWSPVVARSIAIDPLLHQTLWFRLLCAVSLLAGAGGVLRLWLRAVRADNRALAAELAERERAEQALRAEHALEQQLRQSRRLDSLGQLAGGIAHEFNNLLAAIGTNAWLATDGLGGERAQHGDQIQRAVKRGAALTEQLMIFSQRRPQSPARFELSAATEAMAELLRRLAPENISLTVTRSDAPLWVEVDPTRLEQALIQLLNNACEASHDGGVVTFALSEREVGAAEASGYGVPPGRFAVLAVRDEGQGMDEGTLGRVFEPFFTTKSVGAGTGLGLSMAHGVVAEAGGFIAAQSSPGAGATFRLHLPLAAPPERALPPPPRAAAPPPEGATVLVCDDEEAVRFVVGRMLAGAGYQVLEARDARHALALAPTADLLLTDVVMPDMTGPQLAEQVTLPVLFMSGHTRGEAVGMGVGGDAPLLPKPFTRKQLLDAVAEALTRRARAP
jgi:signal transduction histidine kinase/ligand-binding sensor domain-containing protein/CheY-like chemotaxis protein